MTLPTPRYPVTTGRSAPRTVGATPRTRAGNPAKPTTARRWPGPFAVALTLYVAVIAGRLHEAVPFLAPFYPGKVTAALLIVMVVIYRADIDFAAAFRTTVFKCIAAVTVLGILSVPGSAWPTQSVSFFQTQWPQTLLMFTCVVAGFTDRRTAHMGIACFTIAAALGALQLILGAGLDVGGRAYIGGSSQTYDPNMSAAFFAMALPYAMMFAMRPGKMRWAAYATVPALVVAMLKTGSRGGLVALAVLFVALLTVSTKRQRKAYSILLAVSVVTMMIAPHADIVARLREVISGTDYNYTSQGGRLEVWKHGIVLMLTHPLLGVGIAAYETANATTNATWATAHNAYIQIGGELGIAGLVVFLVAIRAAFKSGWRMRRQSAADQARGNEQPESFEHALATASICSLVAVLTAALFLSMAYDAMTLFALAVPTSLALGVARSHRQVLEPSAALARGGARQPVRRSPQPVRGAAPSRTPV